MHLKRPNFFKESGLYIITLLCNWYGYPDNLSSCFVTFSLPSPSPSPSLSRSPSLSPSLSDDDIQKDNYIHRGPTKNSPVKKIQKHKKESNKKFTFIKTLILIFVLITIGGIIYILKTKA